MKTKEEGLKVLEGLKVDMGNKSGTMLMRTLYDQIETSLASGVTREIIGSSGFSVVTPISSVSQTRSGVLVRPAKYAGIIDPGYKCHSSGA